MSKNIKLILKTLSNNKKEIIVSIDDIVETKILEFKNLLEIEKDKTIQMIFAGKEINLNKSFFENNIINDNSSIICIPRKIPKNKEDNAEKHILKKHGEHYWDSLCDEKDKIPLHSNEEIIGLMPDIVVFVLDEIFKNPKLEMELLNKNTQAIFDTIEKNNIYPRICKDLISQKKHIVENKRNRYLPNLNTKSTSDEKKISNEITTENTTENILSTFLNLLTTNNNSTLRTTFHYVYPEINPNTNLELTELTTEDLSIIENLFITTGINKSIITKKYILCGKDPNSTYLELTGNYT